MKIKDDIEDALSTLELNEGIRKYNYYNELGKKKKKRTVIILLFTILGATTGLILLGIPSNITSMPAKGFFDLLSNSSLTYGVLGVTGIAIIANFLFSYLQADQSTQTKPASAKDHSLIIALNRHEKKLSTLEEKYGLIINKIKSGSLSGDIFTHEEKQSILREIRDKLESNTLKGYLLELENSLKESLTNKSTEELYRITKSRLELETQNQTRRGNLNLALGILTAIIGVLILGYSVFQAPMLTTNVELAGHFLPRLSLALIIEVFAYFFLGLYRQSLEEIKYFQNELTKIESKFLGLHIATNISSSDGILAAIIQLVTTERNFLLKKGQSTTQIELKKAEAANTTSLAEKLGTSITSIINSKK